MRRRLMIGIGAVVAAGIASVLAVGVAGIGSSASFVVSAEPPGAAPPSFQELSERLLAPSYAGPDGRIQSAQLLLGQWPHGLPLAVPAPPNGRLLGSVARSAAGTLMSADGVLDVPGSPSDTLAFYERELGAQGWTVSPTGPGRAGGFQPAQSLSGRSFCKSTSGPWLSVTVMARTAALTDVRVHVDVGQPGPCGAYPPGGMPPNGDVLPPLHAPDGVSLQLSQNGGGPNRWTSDATAETDKSAAELEAHFARQLQAAGWARIAGRADGPLAWSTWKLPRDGEWQGLLLAFDAPGHNRRALVARAESASAPGGWSGGMNVVAAVPPAPIAVPVLPQSRPQGSFQRVVSSSSSVVVVPSPTAAPSHGQP